MYNKLRGLISGLVATVLVSIAIFIGHEFGIIPDLSILPEIEHSQYNPVGIPVLPAIGWAVHFFIGTLIWSFIFALFAGKGSTYPARSHALWFSVLMWIVLMAVLMPIAGHGLFGLQAGYSVPMIALLFHLAWAWTISFVYDLLPSAA